MWLVKLKCHHWFLTEGNYKLLCDFWYHFRINSNSSVILPFHATGLFVCFLKLSVNQRFSNVLRGYRKRSVAWNELRWKTPDSHVQNFKLNKDHMVDLLNAFKIMDCQILVLVLNEFDRINWLLFPLKSSENHILKTRYFDGFRGNKT